MGVCFFILFIMSAAFFVKIFNPYTKRTSHRLPPAPPTIPLFGNLLWLLLKPLPHVKALSLSLRERYGPIYTLYMGSKPLIFIASHSLAHEALISNAATFADRPRAMATDKFLSCDQHNITSAFYGPTWLRLRRNLTSNIINSSRSTSFACARKWVLDSLINRLKSLSSSDEYQHIEVREQIQHALFTLFALICFGEKLEDDKIQHIKDLQRRLQSSFDRFKLLNLFPSLGKFLFRKRWEELRRLRRDQEKVFVPLIRARKAMREERYEDEHEHSRVEPFLPYVDTLFDVHLIEEKRKLEEQEIVALCSEFFTGGTDTTSTALEWIMANLVKHPRIQVKLFEEIKGVISEGEAEIKDEDLGKMPYLRAVILESLRLHPPAHFLIPRSVTKDVVLGGFLVPKNSIVTFMVADMGRNADIWENPMEFRPERFLSNGDGRKDFDVTGTKEIKMMAFGAGTRMCPAYRLALLHLEYFLANLILHFHFECGNKDVDFTEKHEFTTVMQNPLEVQITPRPMIMNRLVFGVE
ncbi:hypothetical protein GQ457_11G006000 [Hibiscus cannabinus]